MPIFYTDNASIDALIVSGSLKITGSLTTTGSSAGGGLTASLQGSASFATTASAATSITFTPPTASFAISSSFAESASWAPGGAGSVGGTGTANYLPYWQDSTTLADSVVSQSSAAPYTVSVSGSLLVTNQIIGGSPDVADGTIQVTGSMLVSGNIQLTDAATSLLGSASWAASASNAKSASIATTATSSSYALTSSVTTGQKGYVNFVVDAISGSLNTTGFKGTILLPATFTLTAVRMFNSGSGSIYYDIRQQTIGSYNPIITSGTSITGSTQLSMSNDTSYNDTTLTGWTTTLTEDTILNFFVKEVSGSFNRNTVSMKLIRGT